MHTHAHGQVLMIGEFIPFGVILPTISPALFGSVLAGTLVTGSKRDLLLHKRDLMLHKRDLLPHRGDIRLHKRDLLRHTVAQKRPTNKAYCSKRDAP